MSEPGRSVVVSTGAPHASKVIEITDDVLQEALRKAEDKGRRQERVVQKTAQAAALDAQAAAHAGEIERISAETVHREKAAHAHGFHKSAWMLGVPAALVGAGLGVLGVLAAQDVAFSAGAEATREAVTAGALIERMRDDGGRDTPRLEPQEQD